MPEEDRVYSGPGAEPQDPSQEVADIHEAAENDVFKAPPSVDELSADNQISAPAALAMGSANADEHEEESTEAAQDGTANIAAVRNNDLDAGDPNAPQKQVSDTEVKERIAEVTDHIQKPELDHIRVQVLPATYGGTAVDQTTGDRLSPGDVEIFDRKSGIVHRSIWEQWKERLLEILTGTGS